MDAIISYHNRHKASPVLFDIYNDARQNTTDGSTLCRAMFFKLWPSLCCFRHIVLKPTRLL